MHELYIVSNLSVQYVCMHIIYKCVHCIPRPSVGLVRALAAVSGRLRAVADPVPHRLVALVCGRAGAGGQPAATGCSGVAAELSQRNLEVSSYNVESLTIVLTYNILHSGTATYGHFRRFSSHSNFTKQ